ncbi:TIGR00341 family protein [Candidatus Micrarchaeota archaeon]|nr:TIGR00341 family protein [Candidatus Micrarchaeota archaeon]
MIESFVRKYFSELSEEDKQTVHAEVEEGAHPNIDYYILVAMAAVIAAIGILTDNAVSVIGAMVIAPLMGPLISFALASVKGDIRLFRISLFAEFKGALLVIAIAFIIAYFMPISELTAEILLRTKPTLLDLAIAFASGLVAAYAFVRKLNKTLPGIAISVSILPPLCVVGIGLGMKLPLEITIGALLLFISNVIAINLAAFMIFWIFSFSPKWYWEEKETMKKMKTSIALLILIAIPLAWIMWTSISERNVESTIQEVLTNQLEGIPNHSFSELTYHHEGGIIHVSVILLSPVELDSERVGEIENALSSRLDKEVELEIKVLQFEMIEGEYNIPSKNSNKQEGEMEQ